MDEIKFYAQGYIKSGSPCWAIPVKWVLDAAGYLYDKERSRMHVCVRDRETKKIIDPSKYELFMEGVDYWDAPAIAEDFPPVVWP